MKTGHIVALVVGIVLACIVGVVAVLGIIAAVAVPNLVGVQERTQVNADIRTAEQIARSVELWLIDGTATEIKERQKRIEGKVIEYTDLEGIEILIADMEPNSLEDGEFYVTSVDGKLKVAIAKEAEDVNELSDDFTYDGTGAGWGYIQGSY